MLENEKGRQIFALHEILKDKHTFTLLVDIVLVCPRGKKLSIGLVGTHVKW